MYTIRDFQNINNYENIILTQHGRKRLMERGLSIDDVINAIITGTIIEEYEDDYPFPSCLILGKSSDRVIHVCASIQDGHIYLITAYIPHDNRWENDYRTRKE